MSNNTLLFIIAMFVIAMFAILAYEFLNLNDFALFQSNPKQKQKPEQKCVSIPLEYLKTEVTYKGVTLADLMELCPDTHFHIKDGLGGYLSITLGSKEARAPRKYRSVYVTSLDPCSYELEVSDSSLL